MSQAEAAKAPTMLSDASIFPQLQSIIDGQSDISSWIVLVGHWLAPESFAKASSPRWACESHAARVSDSRPVAYPRTLQMAELVRKHRVSTSYVGEITVNRRRRCEHKMVTRESMLR